MGTTWGPSGADRTQVAPMLAPWTLLSGTGVLTNSLLEDICRYKDYSLIVYFLLNYLNCCMNVVILLSKNYSSSKQKYKDTKFHNKLKKILWINDWFHPSIYWACKYWSMPGLKVYMFVKGVSRVWWQYNSRLNSYGRTFACNNVGKSWVESLPNTTYWMGHYCSSPQVYQQQFIYKHHECIPNKARRAIHSLP